MCDDCCKVIRGWCKSFTKLEILLTLIEALFLALLLALLTFVILHSLACYRPEKYDVGTSTESVTKASEEMPPIGSENVTKVGAKCTWSPSQKTKAVTHYYLNDSLAVTFNPRNYYKNTSGNSQFNFGSVLSLEEPVEVEADSITKGFVAALGEVKPSSEIIIRCILSIISKHWTVTAASCIDSIQVQHLDSFVIAEGDDRRIFSVSDIIVHPKYHAHDWNYDLSAVKSSGGLTDNKKAVLKLPQPLDYFMTTVGEELTILGLENHKNSEAAQIVRGVHKVLVRAMPWQHCDQNSTWAELSSEEADSASESKMQGTCAGARATQAGERRGRYCAGTPLLRARTLLALRTGWRACVRGWGPAPYMSLARHALWLRSLDSSI